MRKFIPNKKFIPFGVIFILGLVLSSAPVTVMAFDDATNSTESSLVETVPMFDALRQIPVSPYNTEHAAITMMTKHQLATTEGAGRFRGFSRAPRLAPSIHLGLNIAVINQINVCAVCGGGIGQFIVGSGSQFIARP